MSEIRQDAETDDPTAQTGVEALQASPDFRGPVESSRHHESNDHLALVYESRDEQFQTAIPFVRQGLERGERCLYIADENSKAEVRAAMETAGIDTEATLESGALTIDTAANSYLQNGAFDPDEMLSILSTAIDDATESYNGFRITGEMTWVLSESTDLEDLIEYETKLNQFFPQANAIALCQYNRKRFSPEIIRDIIKTHPYVVQQQTICQNFYYTPPADFFGPETPKNTVNRMMDTLYDRSTAKNELEERQQSLHEQTEIMADSTQTFEEKLQDLFELGCERFGLDFGGLARVEPETDSFELEYTNATEDAFEPGLEMPLSETFCPAVIDRSGVTAVTDPSLDDFDETIAHQECGVSAYLGTYLEFEATANRTFFFVSQEQKSEGFSDDERTFHRLLSQWVKYELEQEKRERHQRTLYEIAADTDRTFEEKLDAIFELGCERFDLDVGCIARIDKPNDALEIELTSESDGEVVPEGEVPLSEAYCQSIVSGQETISVTDPVGDGFEETAAYDEYGIETYLGTRIELEACQDRTFFFVSDEGRSREFSAAERTFHHLMGQWIKYELEQRHREEDLKESNERLEQFAYAASHDLQEPLRMVSSYLELIDRRYGEELDDTGEEFLEFAVDGADRMREMIDALLTYSRVETHGKSFEPVEMDDVFEGVLESLQIQVEEQNAAISTESLPCVRGDSSQLQQVVQNLLSNAIKYSGEEPPQIHVSAEQHGRKTIISVHDDGIGIDSDNADRIFDVFDRLHSREEYAGTGIGLAICERIIERHGGEIWVESEPGEGSTFSFSLQTSGEFASTRPS
ncbi:MEDS domain-containing protein [Halostagnicola bangensis]